MRQFVANAPKAHESLSTEAQKVPVRGTAIPLICISQWFFALTNIIFFSICSWRSWRTFALSEQMTLLDWLSLRTRFRRLKPCSDNSLYRNVKTCFRATFALQKHELLRRKSVMHLWLLSNHIAFSVLCQGGTALWNANKRYGSTPYRYFLSLGT